MAAEEQQQQSSAQDAQDAPASPPLPARHTAVTPGPRAARFQEMYNLALSHTLNKISYENFAACYPTIAAQAPGVLKQVQKQMVDRLGELCNKEFDLVLQNRNVVPKLNELESLVSDAERRKDEKSGTTAAAPTPPHLLPADDILAAHLAPHLASQQSQINAKLQNMQADNVRLFEEIQAQRTEIETLLAAVEKVLADVDGANGLLDGVVEDLAKETRTVEVEMADS